MEVLIHEKLHRLLDNVFLETCTIEITFDVKKKGLLLHFLVLIAWNTEFGTGLAHLLCHVRTQLLLDFDGLGHGGPRIILELVPLRGAIFNVATVDVAVHVVDDVGNVVMSTTLCNTGNLLDLGVNIALDDLLVFFWVVVARPLIETAEFETARSVNTLETALEPLTLIFADLGFTEFVRFATEFHPEFEHFVAGVNVA